MLPPVPADLEALGRGDTAVISCRSVRNRPDRIWQRMSALERFPVLPGEKFHFHGVETDSPLAPLWLWDLAHACPVGSTLTFTGDDTNKAWLRRRYFADSLKIESADQDSIVFRKTTPLLAEADVGLDAWSFCIPVGPGDPTQLNATVGRILELDVPKFEIILCGAPGKGFLYEDRVRVIGEDIPATPMIPGRKKNRLAQAASHGNLCILHDRVFLPSAFMRAVRAFGDLYPFSTFQSLYFDDRWNLDYRRYSDLHKIGMPKAFLPAGLAEDGTAVSHFSPASRATFEGSGIVHGNALRFDRDRQYLTGSLYLCKRSVWLAAPQSEDIPWGEFEDVEHGLRASEAGIPSRINPCAITQSISARMLFSFGGYVGVEDGGGRQRAHRAMLGPLPLPRKPLLRQSAAAMSENLQTFLVRHCEDPPTTEKWSHFTDRTTGRKRLQSITNALRHVRYPLTEQACHALIADFEKLLLGDKFPFSRSELLAGEFRRPEQRGLAALIKTPELVSQCAQRHGSGVFAADALSVFPKKGIGLLTGSTITALILSYAKRSPLLYSGGMRQLRRDIIDTTPRCGVPIGIKAGR